MPFSCIFMLSALSWGSPTGDGDLQKRYRGEERLSKNPVRLGKQNDSSFHNQTKLPSLKQPSPFYSKNSTGDIRSLNHYKWIRKLPLNWIFSVGEKKNRSCILQLSPNRAIDDTSTGWPANYQFTSEESNKIVLSRNYINFHFGWYRFNGQYNWISSK